MISRKSPVVKLIECPRDAMQGWKEFIPTTDKIEYINSLLQVGFDTIDFGSFVSPKAIPQMVDTKNVVLNLNLENSTTKLLAIVANVRGAEDACNFNQITYLGFPFSISETFQKRNTNSSISESLKTVEQIHELCQKCDKELVVYMSMAFGNPFGDEYNQDVLYQWTGEIINRGIRIVSLSDTVGVATPEQISTALQTLLPHYTSVEFGVHLHSTHENWRAKTEAAFVKGCNRFDGALKGIGGCPMANDELVGNMNTEWLVGYFKEQNALPSLNFEAFQKSAAIATKIFGL